MAQLAITACNRCREQKLKCSREPPICARCAKSNVSCVFPEPPDRKRIAACRTRAKKRKTEADVTGTTASSFDAFHSLISDSQSRVQDGALPPMKPVDSAVRDLPASLQRFLVEVWFSCDYNSSLLFRRIPFFANIDDGTVPDYLLLTLFAASTIYLPPSSARARANMNLLKSIGDLKAAGRQWALDAGRRVLEDIDQPSLAAIQTCEILTIYWFAVGEMPRNMMFSGIALKAALVLGFDKLTKHTQSNLSSSLTPDNVWMEDETKRRCFRSVWFSNCINSDYQVGLPTSDGRIMDLPLPMNDESFKNGLEVPVYTLADKTEGVGSEKGSCDPPSVMAEVMQVTMIWTSIGAHLQARKGLAIKSCIADLFELDDRLSSWSSELSPSLQYSKRNLYQKLVVDEQSGYAFVHVFHHLCRLVLHSSIVPQFSGHQTHHNISNQVISICAKTGVRSAQAISDICADMIALEWDFACLVPFFGYCVYVSASVLAVLLLSSDKAMAAVARRKLKTNLAVLNSMKTYWVHLERLWERINILYEAQDASTLVSSTLDMNWPKNSQEEIGHINNPSPVAGNVPEQITVTPSYRTSGPPPLGRFQPQTNYTESQHSGSYSDLPTSTAGESASYYQHFQQSQTSLWSAPRWPGRSQTGPANVSEQDRQTPYKDTTTTPQAQCDSFQPLFSEDESNDWWQIELDAITEKLLLAGDLPHFDWNWPVNG